MAGSEYSIVSRDKHVILIEDDDEDGNNNNNAANIETEDDEVEIIGTVNNIEIIDIVNNKIPSDTMDTVQMGASYQTIKRKLDIMYTKDIDSVEDQDKVKKLRDVEEDSGICDLTEDVSDIINPPCVSPKTSVGQICQQIGHAMPNLDPGSIRQKVLDVFQHVGYHDPFTANLILNKVFDAPILPKKMLTNEELNNLDIEEASKMTVSDFFDKYDDPCVYFSNQSRGVSEVYKCQANYHLHRLYPGQGDNIQQLLEMNNFHLYPTVHMLENRYVDLGEQLRVAIPARPAEVDPQFVEEVVFCRLVCYIRQHQRKLKAARKEKIAAYLGCGKSVIECSKCLMDCLPEEVMFCANDHPTCRSCLMRSVRQLQMHEGSIYCECSSGLQRKALKQILPLKMFYQLERQREVKCPYCGGPALRKSREMAVCWQWQGCGKQICCLCWRQTHPNKPCGFQTQEMVDIFSIQDELPQYGSQNFYLLKLEAGERREINSSNKLEYLYRMAEGHYHKMMARVSVGLMPAGIPSLPKILTAIEVVVNKQLEKRFKSRKAEFGCEGIPDSEILAFHGTTQESAKLILVENFCMDRVVHGQAHGRGIYFSEFPSFARRYGEVLLLCRLLPGREYIGTTKGVPSDFNSKKVKPPLAAPAEEYGEQILIDNTDQILPAFVLHFQN